MKRSTKYVFLDVHQATTFAVVREESGRIIARAVLPTEEHALVEFVGGMRGSRHVAFEEGTQAQWLCELLSRLVDQVVVCEKQALVSAAQQDPAYGPLRTEIAYDPGR